MASVIINLLAFLLLIAFPLNALPTKDKLTSKDGNAGMREAVLSLTERIKALESDQILVQDNVPSNLLNDTRCQACKLALEFVIFVAGPEWDNVTLSNWTTACMELMIIWNNNSRPDIMCYGVIATQGPHVHRLLVHESTKVSTEEFCETLNYCIPPETTVPRISLTKKKINKDKGDKIPVKTEQAKAAEIRVLQLTDIHIDNKYEEGSPDVCGAYVCCRSYYGGTGSAGRWGSPRCNIPDRTMDLFMDRILEMNPRPDYVIYSGDTPPHHLWEETLDSQMDCTRRLANAFNNKLRPAGLKVFFSVGNHEMFPTNLYFTDLAETQQMTSEFFNLWRDLGELGVQQEETFKKAGYYSIMLTAGLKLLVLNTNYFYSGNYYNVLNDDRIELQEMKEFVVFNLEQSRDLGEKVIFVGHHPPGNGESTVKQGRWLRDVLLQYGDVIAVHMAGHTHISEFRLVTDPVSLMARHIVFVAPSGTTSPNINPSMRVYKLDSVTWQLLDYDQLYLDIRTAHANNSLPLVTHAYSAKSEYGLADMSAQSYLQLTDRMETDQALFEKFWFHQYSGTRDTFSCDDACKKSRLCNLRNAVFDKYLECNAGEATSVTSVIRELLESFMPR